MEENTDKQISNNTQQTSYLINELKNNSVLLGELLCRQLEDSIVATQKEITKANRKFGTTQEWKLLRTPQEKEEQINRIGDFVNRLENSLQYFTDKYNKVKQFLSKKELGE